MNTFAVMDLDRQRSELTLMTRPRTVCIAWERLAPLFFPVGIWIVFLFVIGEEISKSFRSSSFSGVILPGVVVIVFAWFFVRDIRAEIAARQLLMTGDCAVGNVILQEWKGRRRKQREIFYEFKDELGARYHGRGVDLTRARSVGSPVIVFYLLANPTKNVASCCTVWQVRASDGYAFEP